MTHAEIHIPSTIITKSVCSNKNMIHKKKIIKI